MTHLGWKSNASANDPLILDQKIKYLVSHKAWGVGTPPFSDPYRPGLYQIGDV